MVKEITNGWGLLKKISALTTLFIMVGGSFSGIILLVADKVGSSELKACEREIKGEFNAKIEEQNEKIEKLLENFAGLQKVTIINQYAIKFNQETIERILNKP